MKSLPCYVALVVLVMSSKAAGGTILHQNPAGDGAAFEVGLRDGIYGLRQWAFQIPGNLGIAESVDVLIFKSTGDALDLLVEIQTDVAGSPSGNLVAVGASGSVNSSQIGFPDLSQGYPRAPVGGPFASASLLNPVQLTGDPTWVVLSSATSLSNRYYIFFTAGVPSNNIFSTDGGSNWIDTEKDYSPIFRINGTVIPEPTILDLDIKPGGDFNSVNLNSKGVLPVAVLGTDEFDVNDVDLATLLFGDPLLIDNGGTAVSPLRSAYEDVSGDGLLDLTLKFSTADLVEYEALGPDTIEGLLTGLLLDGTSFEGMDSIRIVPQNGSNGNSLQISTVPEPTTSALALAALCLAMSRRRAF